MDDETMGRRGDGTMDAANPMVFSSIVRRLHSKQKPIRGIRIRPRAIFQKQSDGGRARSDTGENRLR